MVEEIPSSLLLAQSPFDTSQLFVVIGILMYVVLGLIALWGAFCVVMVWRRVAQIRFRDEETQSAFLDDVEEQLDAGDFDAVTELCDNDRRAMPQLAVLAVANRESGYSKVRHLVADRFQRDVLADLEYRLSSVYTVIKSAPMVGLLGTVVGMMGAFGKLGGGETVDPKDLATDIRVALVTTACGLAIAIPLVICTNSINVRIRKMEDLVGVGLIRFLEAFKSAIGAGK
jgi:biopolymer transport protein ExbB/TolQ